MSNLPALIAQSKPKLAELLPPGHDVDRVIRLARLAVHRNPYLLKCDPVSVIEAIMHAGQLGLEIGRLAHIVPFKGKAQMIPDYKGLIHLAMASDKVLKIEARLVYAGEAFSVMEGTQAGITHVPTMTAEARDDADIVGAYAVATLAASGVTATLHEWMPRGEVEKIRAISQTGNKAHSPWTNFYGAMAKKTVLKRLLKMLPQDPAVGVAVELDNRYETGSSSASVPGDTAATIARERVEAAQMAQGVPEDETQAEDSSDGE